MQITCLTLKILSIDDQGRGAAECALLLEDVGVILHGVRAFDRPDGQVEINLPTANGLTFPTPHHGEAFAAMTVCAIKRYRENFEADIMRRKAECEAAITQLVAAGQEADRALAEMPSASGLVN